MIKLQKEYEALEKNTKSEKKLAEQLKNDDFVKKYDCGLEVMDTGEHYFHKEEQLNVLKNWIKKHID